MTKAIPMATRATPVPETYRMDVHGETGQNQEQFSKS